VEEGDRPGTLSPRNVWNLLLLRLVSMKRPTHSTVVAYLALFVALGGSTYAVSRIDSGDIRNHSIEGQDIASDTVGARPLRNLPPPRGGGSEAAGSCNPTGGTPIDCAAQTIALRPASSLLIVATGSKDELAGSGVCTIAVDGAQSADEFLSGDQRDGFAITKTTAPLPAGKHTISLQCAESMADLTVDNPTIAAIAVNTQR
jgi:hypothetical protein